MCRSTLVCLCASLNLLVSSEWEAVCGILKIIKLSAMSGCPVHHHGMSKAKGCSHLAASSFTKLFPNLSGLPVSEEEAVIIGGPGGLMHDFNDESCDSEMPAGYTFFAQFVDHDITLDTSSDLHGSALSNNDISKLPNLRTPSLDLDCVYGFGPEGSPHLYDPSKPGRLAENPNGYDLSRSPDGVALIGDPRNDENIFVSQMQLLMHSFHNKLYRDRAHDFEKAQQMTRFHYQWIVLFDFLKRLCSTEVYQFAVPKILDCDEAAYPCFYNGKIPVEFSVAAYRMGHTMVSSFYTVNAENTDVELFDERFGTIGFTSYPEDLVVDWRYLLPVCDCVSPLMTKSIDPLLTDELQNLPVVGSRNPADRALAFRNLLRGNVMSLPSGQAVASELKTKGYPVNDALDLKLGEVKGWSRLEAIERSGESLSAATPLFYYILRESQLVESGKRLGPVGSAILLEVFGGMLVHCGTSFIKYGKEHGSVWQPDPCVSKEKVGWWTSAYEEVFSMDALIGDPSYFPLELADVVRFVSDKKCGCESKCC